MDREDSSPRPRTDLAKKVGSRIWSLRQSKGWSQKTLASKIKASQTQVSEWETGAVLCGESNLKKLATLFGVEIAAMTIGQSNSSDALPINEHLGSYANSLPGAWQFFYVRPLNDDGLPKPQIRCHIGIFGRARPESISMTFMLITRENQWRGNAIRHEPHFCITCKDQRGGDTSFIVINAPRKRDYDMFAGLALAPLRPTGSTFSVGALVCFGQQLKLEILNETQANAIRDVMSEDAVSDDSEIVIRNMISSYECEAHDFDRFRAAHQRLFSYVDRVMINGGPGAITESLRINWP